MALNRRMINEFGMKLNQPWPTLNILSLYTPAGTQNNHLKTHLQFWTRDLCIRSMNANHLTSSFGFSVTAVTPNTFAKHVVCLTKCIMRYVQFYIEINCYSISILNSTGFWLRHWHCRETRSHFDIFSTFHSAFSCFIHSDLLPDSLRACQFAIVPPPLSLLMMPRWFRGGNEWFAALKPVTWAFACSLLCSL